MKLFHYHWWTDKVEEMENFYAKLGFEVTLRAGRYNGEFATFNPPLTWDDFRDKKIAFRIIEMRKGQTNITFGNGKRDLFDHIGFIVDEEEYQIIIQRASEMNWKVNEGERRTFISTPWKFRIELQKRNDVITKIEDTMIQTMEINMPFNHNPALIAKLLGLKITQENKELVKLESPNWSIVCFQHNDTNLNSVAFLSKDVFDQVDPVDSRLITVF